jgi:hypothetical protein
MVDLDLLCLQAKEKFTYRYVITHTHNREKEFEKRISRGMRRENVLE